MKTAIFLFDLTGNMAKPWVDAGYECWLFDIQHPEGVTKKENGLYTVGCDLSEIPSIISELKHIAFVGCFPPCTDLAVSGARWFKKKEEENPGTRERAMQMVYNCLLICESIGAPYFIENPVSVISSEWRKPDYKFHPYQFTGYEPLDNYTKKTCLWTGNGFVMPEPNQIDLGKPDDRIHKCAPGPERANIRSATPMGFAKAVFAANKPFFFY